MMRTPHTSILSGVLVLTLCAGALRAQTVERTAKIVIRHDPDLIALNSDLLQSGLHPRVEVTESGAPQPAGVFVGTLIAKGPKGTDQELMEDLLTKSIGTMQKNLNDRLYSEPLNRVLVQVEETKNEIQRLRTRIEKLRRGQDPFAARNLVTRETELTRVTASIAEVTLEIRTDEPMLDLLRQELAKASRRLVDESANVRQLEYELGFVDAKLNGQAASDELRKRFATITARHESARASAEILAGTVQQRSSEIDRTTVRLNRSKFRLNALQKQWAEASKNMEVAREREQVRREKEMLAQAHDDRLVALRDSLAELQARSRAIRPVRVRRW